MKRMLLTGNAAAAWGARLANVDYVPAFPITPQTEIIETISNWIDKSRRRWMRMPASAPPMTFGKALAPFWRSVNRIGQEGRL